MAYKTDNSLLYAQAVQAARKRRQEEWEDYATRNGITVYPQTISYEERQSLDASMSDFANRANNFLKRSSLNLRGMDYDNYKELYQYNAPNYSKLRTEAAELRFQVEKNKDFLNKKEYERYMSLLDEFSKSSSQIHDLTENTRETMSQFKNRDEYDLAMEYLKSSSDVKSDIQDKQEILDNRPSRAHLIEQNLRSGMKRKDAIASADAYIAAYYQSNGLDSVTNKRQMKDYLNTMEGIEANVRLNEAEKEARQNPAATKQKAQGLDLINRISRLNNDKSLVEAAGYTPDAAPDTYGQALVNRLFGRNNLSSDLAIDANAYALAESNVRRQSVLDSLTEIGMSDPNFKTIVNDSADERSKRYARHPDHLTTQERETRLLPYMTDEEYSVYSALSPDNQRAYYAALEEDLNSRAAKDGAKKLEGSALAEIATRYATGFAGNIESAGKFFDDSDYINTTQTGFLNQYVAQDMQNKGWVVRTAGDIADTIGNMTPSIIVSTLASGGLGAVGVAAGTAAKVGSILGTAEMGLAAAGQTYAELLNSGKGKELARTMSIIQGVWEGASEYYLGSIEALGANRIAARLTGTNFEKMAEKLLGGWAKFFVNSGIDALQEGAEEVIQDIGGTMLEKLVTGEWNPSTPDEKIQEFLMGAASAFFMNAPGTASDIVNARQARNQYRGQEQELVNKGLQSPQGSDSRRLAEIYQEQMNQNRDLSGLQIKNLVEANDEVSQRRADLADLSTNIDEDRIDKNAKDIVRVKSIGNDGLTVVYDDGTEASNADIKFKDKGEAAMFQNFVDKGYDVEAAEQVMKLARESDLPMTEFVLAANEAFKYGRLNADLKNVRPVFMGDLNTADQQTIYEMGRSYADRQLTREQLKSAGILRRSIVSGNISLPKAYNDLSNIQKASVTALAWVTSKITKNKVVFYNSVKNENGDFVYEDTIEGTQIVKGQKASNGMYSNGTVYIDLNAGNKGEGSILWTASHEFTHLMKENAKAEYKALADFVTNRIGNIDDLVQYQMAKAEQSGHAIDETVAEEEVIADAMSEMLASEDVVQQMLKLKYENRPLFNRMKNFFTRIYERVTKEYSAISEQLLPQEARILRQFGDDLGKVKNLFSEGLVAVGNNGVMMRGDTDLRHMSRDEYGNVVVDDDVSLDTVKNTLQDLSESKEKPETFTFPIMKTTPQIYVDLLGLKGTRSLVMSSDKAYDAVIGKHSMGVEGVMEVIEKLPYPSRIIEEGGYNLGHYAAIIENDNGEAVAALEFHNERRGKNGSINGEDGYYDVLISTYDTLDFKTAKRYKTFEEYIEKDIEGKALRIIETDEWIEANKKEDSDITRDSDSRPGDHSESSGNYPTRNSPRSQEPSSEISYLSRNDGEAAAQGEYSDDATASFEDSNIATKNQIRTPYTEGTKAWEEFTSNLEPEAKKTHDMFYNFFTLSKLNNTTDTKGDRVKKLNISSVFLTAQQWNEKLEQSPDWKACAEKLAASLPENVRKAMHFNLDGTLEYTDLEKEFKMQKSLAQRLVDSLGYEVIDSEYELGGKKIKLSTGGAVQSVGGEAYRRALIAETRKLYNEGRLKQVKISTMSKDRWGSLGFLAENQKTGASGDFTTICPQMMFNKGCYYCYRRAALESGVNNKLVAESVWYTGEILRIKDEDIKELNKKGGLRIQSFGDWMPHFSAQLADVIYDAEQRGLQVKIITKEPSMIEYVARLREQGLGKNLYFNLSADYAIEKFAPTGLSSVEAVNENRPYMRRASDNTFWWKRAMTVEEAAKYREKYPWVNVRIVATTLEEYIRGLKDPNVQVVTGYHGHIREWERIDSTTGEQKVQVEPLGDAGMPRFYFNGKTWNIEFEGKTKTHKRLAEAIQAEGLERDYYNKACCITGRCSECEGKCGALANNFYVKNATNADAESVAYWEEHMTNPQEDIESEMERADVRHSARDTYAEESKQTPMLRTLNGSPIQRSRTYGVGKEIGGKVYVHKNYADEVVPADILDRATDIINDYGFEYNTIMYDPSNPNIVRFDEAPDFDTAREPIPGTMMNVDVESGTVTKARGNGNMIWHHKWQWVHNDYDGFDVQESYDWSKEWLTKITNPSGSLRVWNQALRDNGLPLDAETKYSSRDLIQKHTSADTSVNSTKVPALYTNKNAVFVSGGTNIDIGAGKFDTATDYLAGKGVTSLPYDPFNRSKAVNLEVLDFLRSGKRADTATCSNVLNVIDTAEGRANVILQMAKSIKPDGTAYFTVYENKANLEAGKAGESARKPDQWQEFRAASTYVDEIKQYFDDVSAPKSGLIIAKSPKANLPEASWQISDRRGTVGETTDEFIRYSNRNTSNADKFNALFAETDDGRVRAINANDLSTEDWQLIYKATKKLGYDVKSAADAKNIFTRYGQAERGFTKDQSDAIRAAYGVTGDAKASLVNDARAAAAKKEFGLTGNFSEAGYLLRDGKMLDFSGKREGGSGGMRAMDHRDINRVFDERLPGSESSGTPYMNAFIAEGNIRLMDGQGVTIGETEPTASQYAVLKRFIDRVKNSEDYFYLDISNNDGYTIESREYSGADSSTRIINDIKQYYKNGELPYRSELQNFRYSDRVPIGTLFSGGDTFASALNGVVHTQFAAENRPEITAVYQANHDGFVFDDVLKMKPEEMPDIQYLMVTPPCVNLSGIRTDRGERPIDKTLAKKVTEILEAKRPRAFSLENVPGYATTESLNMIRNTLKKLGYNVDIRTYKDSDYGGYTNRERVILRAMRDEALPPVADKVKTKKGWIEAVGEDYVRNLPDAKSVNPRMIQSLNRDGINPYKVTRPLLVFGESYKNGSFGHAYSTQTAPTIIAESGASRVFLPGGTVKEATPEMLAKLMGLDDYVLPDSKVTALRVIGNGIPAAITNAALRPIAEMLQAENAQREAAGLGIRYQNREVTIQNSRELLANALESTLQNEDERNLLDTYKSQMKILNDQQSELDAVRKQIADISFTAGSDRSRLPALREKSAKLSAAIQRQDKKLLKLESMQSLKNVLDREITKARRKVLEEYRADEKDRQISRDLRTRVKRQVEEFRKRLTNPTDRRYIPRGLVGGIVSVYDAIDQTGVRQDTKAAEKYRTAKEALNALKAEYDKLEYDADNDFSSEFNRDFSRLISELADSVGDTPLRDMNREQLEDVYGIIHDISAMLTDATRQIGKAERISNYEAGQEVITNMRDVKAKGLTTNKVSTFFREWMTNPMRAVREMSGFGKDARLVKMFDELNEGRRKADTFRMESTKKFDALRSGKTGKNAFDDAVQKASVTVSDMNGEDAKISKMQAMQAILTYYREQNNKHRSHLDTPVRFTDVDLEVKGKYTEAFDNGKDIVVDSAFVAKVMDQLSDWDKQYLETARSWLNNEAKDAINEVSLVTRHRIVAAENDYIPYYLNDDYIAKESDNVKFDATIDSMGIMKSVKSNATQQLVMRGLNVVLADHIDKVAKIYGLMIPVRNFNKIFNMKQTRDDGGNTVKSAISDTWGKKGEKLVDQAVADVQSNRRADSVAAVGGIKSAFVVSTLASNLSVWMKQAASYPTAGSILSAGSLVKALPNFTKNLDAVYDEIDQHTSQHWIRRQGLSTQELGEMNQSRGWANRLNEKMGNWSPMNWIQSMDVKTTAVLWEACKNEVESRGLSQEDDGYWDQVTDLYDRVIEETQPMYDPLHRAEVTKNPGLKNIIMFQTQPIQNSGILRDGALQYKMAKKEFGANSEEAKAAGAEFKKAVTSQLASHFVFTAMTLTAAALLHRMDPYRDEDDELTSESVLKKFAEDYASNVFNAIVPVLGNYAVTATQKVFGGSRYDILSDPVVDKINSSFDYLARLKEPNFTNFTNAFCDIASYFGIPAKNAYNIINGAVLHAKDAINGEFLSFETGMDRTNTQDIRRMYNAYMDGDTDKTARVFQGLIDEYAAKGKSETDAKSTIQSTLTQTIRPLFLQAYEDKDNDKMAAIRKFLNSLGVYKDVVKTTQDWIKKSKETK